MPFAAFEDVAVYAPDMERAEDEAKVAALLEQAEAELLIEFPDLEERVDDGRTRLINVKRVEAEMVASVMRNPKGLNSESESIGDLSSSQTVNAASASGLLMVTDNHRALIRGTRAAAPAATSGGIYSIGLTAW